MTVTNLMSAPIGHNSGMEAKAVKRAARIAAKRLAKATTDKALADTPKAAFGYARSHGAVLALVMACRDNPVAVKLQQIAFHIGFMASRLNPDASEPTETMLANAKVILGLKGNASKVEADKKRTPVQDTAYDASRKAWSRVSQQAEAVKTDNRGGANNRKPSGAVAKIGTTEATDKMLKDATPAAKTSGDCLMYLQTQAATMKAYCDKHAKIITPQQSSAVTDFATAIAALSK